MSLGFMWEDHGLSSSVCPSNVLPSIFCFDIQIAMSIRRRNLVKSLLGLASHLSDHLLTPRLSQGSQSTGVSGTRCLGQG